MKKQLVAFIAYFLLALAPAHAKIIEVAHFQELVQFVTPDTLTLLDIDDTLLIPAQMVGSDEWFIRQLEDNTSICIDKNSALEVTLAQWEALRHITKMKIVEQGTEEIVKRLQIQGHKVMALTTQGISLATRTVQQLKENNINLETSAPLPSDFFLDLGGHGILYRKGVLFTSGTNKGKALFSLCEGIGFKPKRIVFINDKASHLREIEQEAEHRGVEFIGLRYAYADIHKAKFTMAVADYQFTHSNFAQILSDEEALEAVSARK